MHSNPKTYRYVILLPLLLWLGSCTHSCIPRVINSVMIQRYDSIADTAALVIKYAGGTNFSKVIDSTYETIGVYNMPSISHGSFGYDFSDAGKDYVIKLLPSGEAHTVTGIHYGNEKDKGGIGIGEHKPVVCSFDYTLDGNVVGNGSYQEDGNVGGGWIGL